MDTNTRAAASGDAAQAQATTVQFGIEMVACTSSNLEAWGYQASNQTLALRFRGGRVYHYVDVPQHVADAMAQATSKGSYAAREITGKFAGTPMGVPS